MKLEDWRPGEPVEEELRDAFRFTGLDLRRWSHVTREWVEGLLRAEFFRGHLRGLAERAEKVTRFEVIDHTTGQAKVHYSPCHGRSVVASGVSVELSIQDDGRTLKVFLTSTAD